MSNPYDPGTWSYRFWQNGYNNPDKDAPTFYNEIAAILYKTGQAARKEEAKGEKDG